MDASLPVGPADIQREGRGMKANSRLQRLLRLDLSVYVASPSRSDVLCG
ncbi:MAG: hypothetical protein AAGI08_15760 [Bacteroidota bacterium]